MSKSIDELSVTMILDDGNETQVIDVETVEALITEARIDELDLFLRQDILTNGKYSIIERKKELRNEKA